ncbi:TonB-dependent receptor [Mesorhizobium sp. M0179]|uniref:TonB-dependent receptor domain-containing protein n=1 Tax=Mesorhizobium sp. M0179 TaxID=2956905 RepID=UPI00333A8268
MVAASFSVAQAKINGFELESVYDAAWGYAGLSASITNGHTISDEGERADLATIPSSQVTGQLGFRFLQDKLTVGGEVQYNGKPKGNPVAKDYTLVNAFASYQATDNLKVDFRADNLFDVKYTNPLNGGTTAVIYEPGTDAPDRCSPDPVVQNFPSPCPSSKFQVRRWLAWRSLAFFIPSGVLNIDSFSPVLH